MTDIHQLDRTCHFILETFVNRGDAVHYTEIAKEFTVHPDKAILSLSYVMAVMSTPCHSARLNSNYVSSASGYAPLFIRKLKEVTNNASFWAPNTT